MRVVLAAMLLASVQAHAQVSEDIPRTHDGRPDFQGLWFAESLTQLERDDDIKTLVIAPEDADAAIKTLTPDFGDVYDPESDSFFSKRLMSVKGELRSSLIVEPADGKLPLTALARAVFKHEGPEFDNPEERPAPERCVDSLAFAPLSTVGVIIPLLFVQTPETILIAAEDMNPARIVDLTARAPRNVQRSRIGHAAGRWDGDTLTVETTHISATDPSGLNFRGPVPISEASRVIEHFTLLSPDLILYRFTVEDAALYSRPWLAEMVLERYDGPFYEYACHEGNRSMPSILLAGRLGRQIKEETTDKDKDSDKPAQ